MGRVWLDVVAAYADWEPAALVDPDRERLMEAAARYNISKSRCFQDLKEALSRVTADALIDATPPASRKAVCTAAFRSGLHVLAEKPLADNLRNAALLVRRAEQAGRIFMVAQNYRFHPEPQTVKRFVERGRVGDVGYAGIDFHRGPRFGGFRERMAYPLLLDMSIHHIDLLRCILGRDIVRVTAHSANPPWSWFKGDAAVMAQFELEGGLPVAYFASWAGLGAETSWNGDWRIAGSKGTLRWVGADIAFSPEGVRRRKVPMVKWPATHQAYLLEAFTRCLETGEEPETSAARNLNSLAATHAAVRSAREGRAVAVDDVMP
jgi:predicted dehydrogenase